MAALVLVGLLSLLSSTAFAGGPLLLNATTKTPYAYGPGTIPVYYDTGNFAVVTDWANYPNQVVLNNAVGRHVVEKGYQDWSNIQTASVRAKVIGDFASVGLPDITGDNAAEVIGKFNGGGIFVIFDADGSVMENFFGVGPNILGISSPEVGKDGTSIILESWTVLNGQAIDAQDTDAAQYQGVATHEFGHSLGLAHTQTNGAAVFYGDPVGPQSCATLPYATNLTKADTETMYPYSYPVPNVGTGIAQANIHTLDDIAAISDLYPGPGWPNAYGTISGKILDVDGKTQLTGVNVIARNIADPFADATSAISGQWTQGLFGPDGTFTLHGLKPGAQYAVYVDAVKAGGFPTPPLWFLPGAEKFYNGPDKGMPTIDAVNRCEYKAISASAGTVATANIKFDRVKNAPVLFNLGYGAGATDITGDGTTVVGNYGRAGPVFRWTAKTGIQTMNATSTGDLTFISRNGAYISSDLLSDQNINLGAFRWDGKRGWNPVAPVGYCGTDTTAAHGVANDGTVYGLAYTTNCDYRPFHWNPKTGTALLPAATTLPDGSLASGRPNRISADGSTVVGWEQDVFGYRQGVVWVHGTPSLIKNASGEPIGEANATSSDGSIIAGSPLYLTQEPLGKGWRKRADSTTLEYFDPVSADAAPANPFALSGDGGVMAGLSGDPWYSLSPAPFLWTTHMGSVNLNEFVQRQGTSMEQFVSLWTPMAISDDGSVMTGWGIGFQWYGGWVLQIHNAFVCHASPASPDNGHTISVAFPKSFDQHLAHGDTVGPCQDHQD